ncbi:probable insulin-like peptide 7 [Limulus polyphemus]|uniref:Probable insulin-like peptide 7 n=1 Tax=Limulus polyphemus TaxID=6850 RepID=A0ABM1SNG8_LIMPO|nr:probable insulin-like peptide 7 [Limulus polyphemus]
MEKVQQSQSFVSHLWTTFLIVSFVSASAHSSWETVFRTRSRFDWQAVWHEERHQRCFQELFSHMEWACRKDVYKLERIKRHSTMIQRSMGDTGSFLPETLAHSILRNAKPSRSYRFTKRGIMYECCHSSMGCSWEEYAEYCPLNRRIRN